jgi:PAS domain-containing protein
VPAPAGSHTILVVCDDTTERELAKEALRESEERFRSAFESAAMGMALVGLDRPTHQAGGACLRRRDCSAESAASIKALCGEPGGNTPSPTAHFGVLRKHPP